MPETAAPDCTSGTLCPLCHWELLQQSPLSPASTLGRPAASSLSSSCSWLHLATVYKPLFVRQNSSMYRYQKLLKTGIRSLLRTHPLLCFPWTRRPWISRPSSRPTRISRCPVSDVPFLLSQQDGLWELLFRWRQLEFGTTTRQRTTCVIFTVSPYFSYLNKTDLNKKILTIRPFLSWKLLIRFSWHFLQNWLINKYYCRKR